MCIRDRLEKFLSNPNNFLLAENGIQISVARFPNVPNKEMKRNHIPEAYRINIVVSSMIFTHSKFDVSDPFVQISLSTSYSSLPMLHAIVPFILLIYFAPQPMLYSHSKLVEIMQYEILIK